MASLASFIPNLSLSVIPLFLASPLTTISTSLNVLLLNLTYTSLTLSYTPLRIELFLTLAARALFLLLPALLTTAILNAAPAYAIDRSFESQRRVGKVDAKRVAYVAATVGCNVLLPVVVQGVIEFLLTGVVGWPSALRLPRTLPMPGSILWDVFWVYCLKGIVGYTVHRFLLHDPRGGKMSDWHWEFVHDRWGSRITPLLPLLEHPWNYLLSQWLPVYLPCALLRTHLLTYTLLTTITSLESSLTHSYLSPPSFLLHLTPFYAWSPLHLFGVKARTERHYEHDGECAFEGWGVLDWCFGTSGPGEGPEGARQRVEGAPGARKAKGAVRRKGKSYADAIRGRANGPKSRRAD